MSDIRSPGGGRSSSFEDDDLEEVTAVSVRPTLEGRRVEPATPRDRATFTLISGPSAGTIFTLLADEHVIGRGKECAIRIDDPGISRRHARIVRRAPKTYFVEDLGSRNGTFVAGHRVTDQLLSEGDRVSIDRIDFRFDFTDEAEEGLMRRLFESSVLDALTGAYNRKHFSERMIAEIAYAKRHGTPVSLVLFDIDHFKKINDSFGHLGGDHVLRSVAALVRKTLRAEDIFARYGGEEFAIIARGIDVQRALMLAERMRLTIALAKIECNRAPVFVTVSIGVASLACCGENPGIETLVAKADRRLYAAKSTGRNRTVWK
ncbi:MAG TPA: GGDEF domain-containing protein [Polyangiaceae bacterium]